MFILLLVIIFFISLNSILNIHFFNGFFNNFNVFFSFSLISGFCLFMLILCGIISIYFSLHYFNWSINNLNNLIIFFLLIMTYLVFTNSFYNTLFAWEYLGVVSFFLILYYSNYDTTRAANITLVSSRFGDVGLFIVLCFSFFNYNLSVMYSIFFLLVIITKSAIIPFSSWLLEAMRAPTPVSCLVHSSTLVAAGIWFFLNYSFLSNVLIHTVLLVLCLLSIILSSLCVLFLNDIKKIIALSTCNNVSWCFIYFLNGNEYLCLIQLVTHGIAKCMLFCIIGDILSCSLSNQFNSGIYNIHNGNLINPLLSIFLVFFISGLPFFGVYFSKHFLLTCLYNINNVLINILIFFCILLTYIYSMRLFCLISFIFIGQNSGLRLSYNFISTLVILSCLVNFYEIYNSEEYMMVDALISWLIIVLQFIGLCLGYLFYRNNLNKINNFFFGQDLLIFLNNIILNHINNFFLFLGSFRFERYINTISFSSNLFFFNMSGIILVCIINLIFLIFIVLI